MSYNRRPPSSANWRDRAHRDRDRDRYYDTGYRDTGYYDAGYYDAGYYDSGYYDSHSYGAYDASSSSQTTTSSSRYGGYWSEHQQHAYHPYAAPYRDRGPEVNYYGDNRYYPYAAYPDSSSSHRSTATSRHATQSRDYDSADYQQRRPRRQDRPSKMDNEHQQNHTTTMTTTHEPPIDADILRRHRRDDRSVTPPPPQSPSPEYIELANAPPARLGSPASQRKLLILDLNGTLVHRAPMVRGKPRGPPSLDANGLPLPRLRPTHPRPYMPAFRAYVSARETKAWLDVMVWSSAQPHSVDDMVRHCFGAQREDLLAVWARDTLGLSADHYYRKVQTVKDLNTPWTKLASLSSSSHAGADGSSSPAHSALTTLLLDDSPRKAELQPYNHFCVPEYSGAMRASDLRIFHAEQQRRAAAVEQTEEDMAAEVEVDADAAESPNATDPATTGTRKHRHKQKTRHSVDTAGKEELGAYDETLLAVIGVLEEVKTQQNVAAWVRAGGLWGPRGEGDECAAGVDAAKAEVVDAQTDAQTEAAEAANDNDTEQTTPDRQARRKERKRQRQLAKRVAAGLEPPPAGNDAGSSAQSPSASVAAEGEKPSMWFEHPPTVAYWAERGRRALESLGIEVEHGIER